MDSFFLAVGNVSSVLYLLSGFSYGALQVGRDSNLTVETAIAPQPSSSLSPFLTKFHPAREGIQLEWMELPSVSPQPLASTLWASARLKNLGRVQLRGSNTRVRVWVLPDHSESSRALLTRVSEGSASWRMVGYCSANSMRFVGMYR